MDTSACLQRGLIALQIAIERMTSDGNLCMDYPREKACLKQDGPSLQNKSKDLLNYIYNLTACSATQNNNDNPSHFAIVFTLCKCISNLIIEIFSTFLN